MNIQVLKASKRFVGVLAALAFAFAALTMAGCSQDQQESSSSTAESTSSSTEATDMPNVIGLTEQAATDKLENLGLSVSVEYEEVDDSSQAGVVTAQDPDEGEQLDAGDAVTITVGQQEESSSSASESSSSAASSSTSSSSGVSVSNTMNAADTGYDASNLPKKYRSYYDAGATALQSGDYKTLASNVASLYSEYPNAAQSLVNSAKSESWYAKFKKQLLKQDAGAEDLLDLDD